MAHMYVIIVTLRIMFAGFVKLQCWFSIKPIVAQHRVLNEGVFTGLINNWPQPG